MAYTSKGTMTPKTALQPGQYPGIFRAPIKDKTLAAQYIKDPSKDDGVRAEWTFEVVDTEGQGDGEMVEMLTSTYLSLDSNTMEPKSGAAKLCAALNFGKAPWAGTDRESLRAFDWESLDGRPVLLNIDVNASGYAKVKDFTPLPRAMWPMVTGRASVPVVAAKPAPQAYAPPAEIVQSPTVPDEPPNFADAPPDFADDVAF